MSIINDNHQELRLRRTIIALCIAFVHTIICALLLRYGFFRMTILQFIALFVFFWTIHFIFPYLIITNRNLSFSDPSLSFPQIIWGITCLMITIYFTDQLRTVLLMMSFLAFLFCWFQFSWHAFNFIAAFAVLSYACVVFLLWNTEGVTFSMPKELIVLLSYSLVTLCFSMVSAEITEFRTKIWAEKKVLHQSLQKLSHEVMIDELTGIKNRRGILSILERQKWLVERRNMDYEFAICILDIDKFKQVNDNYGHQVGDKILISICKLFDTVLRKIDYFGRIGGEEFLLVAPYANEEQIKLIAERLRQALEQHIFYQESNIAIHLTTSIGVTVYHPMEEITETLKRADNALYHAKNKGRNRIYFL